MRPNLGLCSVLLHCNILDCEPSISFVSLRSHLSGLIAWFINPCSSQDETSANSKKCIQRNTIHCTLGFLLDFFYSRNLLQMKPALEERIRTDVLVFVFLTVAVQRLLVAKSKFAVLLRLGAAEASHASGLPLVFRLAIVLLLLKARSPKI